MSVPAAPLPRPDTPGYFASHWRSLDYFNLYRLTLALALVFTGVLFDSSDLFSPGSGTRFQTYAFAYLVVTALFVLGIRARWPSFQIQLTAHILADIVFIILMMGTSAQLAGGLGLLLVISIASGGLVGSGRLSLLYAALASIALLLQNTFGLFAGSGAVGRWALSAVASLIIGALLAWIWRTRSAVTAAAAGLIAGGAIGNLVDRLRFGAVTDFIDLHWGAAHWPTFNLADAAIVCGVALLLLTVRGSDSRAASSTLGRAAR